VSTPIPVRRIELDRMSDGRQRLLVELDNDERTQFVVFGTLTAKPHIGSDSLALGTDLVMKASTGDTRHWATLSVTPPHSVFDGHHDYLGYD